MRWPHMKVFDNVAYPLKLRKVSKDEIKSEVMRVLKVVHLEGLENRMAHELSGGQLQRLVIARPAAGSSFHRGGQACFCAGRFLYRRRY